MKLDPEYKPELCVSTESDRWNLSAPYYDKDSGMVVATNGHHMVVVPAEVEEGDVAQHLPAEDLARARQPDMPPPEEPDRDRGRFPDWKAVKPEFEPFSPGTVTFGLNAAYLLEISRAMGAYRDQVVLTVHAQDQLRPIFVTRSEHFGPRHPFGILMPCRLSDPRPKPPRELTPSELAQQAEEESKAVAEAQRAAELLVLEARKKALLDRAAQLEDEIEELARPAAPALAGEVADG